MSGTRVGLLATVAVTLALLPPASPHAQEQTTDTVGMPVHTIKITVVEDAEKHCIISRIVPERAGVYPGNWLVWNLENGCRAPVTVRISGPLPVEGQADAPRLLFEQDQRPIEVSAKPLNIAYQKRRVTPNVKLQEGQQFEYSYTIDILKSAQAGEAAEPRIALCNEPPCPQPM